ncbi:hypothetical protein D3C79_425640 [compost metagenome]
MPLAPVDQHQLGAAGGPCGFTHQCFMRVAAFLQRLDEAAREPQREPCQGHGSERLAPGRPALQPALEQPRQQWRDGQHQARQRREDIQLALAAAEAEKQQHQHHPAEQQQKACVAFLQLPAPGRYQPGQGQHQWQPVFGDDLDEEVPERFAMVPGIGIAAGGLAQQDFLQVGQLCRATAMGNRYQQRQQPHRATGQQPQQPQAPAPTLAGHGHHPVPAVAHRPGIGQQ